MRATVERPTTSRAPATIGLLVGLILATIVPGAAATARAAADYVPLPQPQRMLDTRPGGTTIDGRQVGGGPAASGSTLVLPLADRGDLPADPTAVVVNLTAVAAAEPGYVAARSCDVASSATSNLNFVPTETVATMAIVPVAADGTICLDVLGMTDLVVDALGSAGSGAFDPLRPAARVLDTRRGFPTVDGEAAAGGTFAAGEIRRVPLAGRAGLSARPGTLLLTMTAIGRAPGFVTAWGCDGDRPATSNVNFAAGQIAANGAIVDIGAAGELCLRNRADTHLLLDVVAHLPGPPAPAGAAGCPAQ